MVNEISIQNYKSIKNLDIQLGRLNVFIGENGCGKTNILEAITCCSIVAETESTLLDTMMSLRGVRITEPHLMKSAFEAITEDDVVQNRLSMLRKNPNLIAEISISNQFNEAFGIKIYNYEQGSWAVGLYVENLKAETHEYVKSIEDNNSSLPMPKYKPYLDYMFGKNAISAFINYSPENYFLRRFEEEGQIKPLGIRGEGLFKHLTEISKKKPDLLLAIGEKLRLISWFKEFEIPKNLAYTEQRINIKDKYLKEIDFFDQRSANEGFLYLLFYFTLFNSPYTPSFFAIDNIDNALNPKLCAELTLQLAALTKQHNKQVILTTHNPAILDGLDLTDDDQRLFTIYRNADGHTIAKRIKPPKEVNGVEKVRLSEAYIRGYIGGLPKNF
jgi:AAA15 family ATPase/GTPase